MPTRIQKHLEANIVGYVALFVALSGSAYAAASLPKNSVTSKSIKRGAVTAQKLANNSVTGSKVRDQSLSAVDFAGGTVLPRADSAGRADTAGRADSAGSADTAGRADSAGNADLFGGAAPGAFLKGADPILGGSLTGSYAQPALAGNAVTGANVTNGSLAGADLAPNSVGGQQINEATLAGVDAASVGGAPHFELAGSRGNLRTETFVQQFHTDDLADNTVVLRNPRFSLRATGNPHSFKLCSESTSATKHFIVETGAGTGTQSLTNSDCGAAINTGGAGTTVPGRFTIWAPHAIVFGTPFTQSNVTSNTEQYQVIAIGWALGEF